MTLKSFLSPKDTDLTTFQGVIYFIYAGAGGIAFLLAIQDKEYSNFSLLFMTALLLIFGGWFFPKIKKNYFIILMGVITFILLAGYFLAPVLYYFLEEINIYPNILNMFLFALALVLFISARKNAE